MLELCIPKLEPWNTSLAIFGGFWWLGEQKLGASTEKKLPPSVISWGIQPDPWGDATGYFHGIEPSIRINTGCMGFSKKVNTPIYGQFNAGNEILTYSQGRQTENNEYWAKSSNSSTNFGKKSLQVLSRFLTLSDLHSQLISRWNPSCFQKAEIIPRLW